MVNVIKLKYNFVETPRKFIIAKLLTRLSSNLYLRIIISTDEDASLRIESFAIISFHKLYTLKIYSV